MRYGRVYNRYPTIKFIKKDSQTTAFDIILKETQ